MFRNVCICLLIQVILFTIVASIDLRNTTSHGRIVRYSYHPTSPTYYIFSNVKHEMPDKYTILAYGYNVYEFMGAIEYQHLKTIEILKNSMFNDFTTGEKIDSLWDNHPNRYAISFINNQTFKVEENVKFLSNVLNPSILFRFQHKEWILALVNTKESSSFKMRIFRIPFKRQTSMYKNLYESVNWLSLEQSTSWFSDTNTPYPVSIETKGEDPRLFETSAGKLYLLYNYASKVYPYIRQTYLELSHHKTNDKKLIITRRIKINSTENEKNWTPFEFNNRQSLPHVHGNSMYFVKSVQPFHVVRTYVDETISFMGQVDTINIAEDLDEKSCFPFAWASTQPMLRGGTPAVRYAKSSYLAIFHSSNNISSADNHNFNGILKTYFMGAYTFTSNATGHFHISSISAYPILDNTDVSVWYKGKWLYRPAAFGLIDYVVFPTSLFIGTAGSAEGGQRYVYIAYGYQDEEAWILRIALNTLLGSMLQVNNSDERRTCSNPDPSLMYAFIEQSNVNVNVHVNGIKQQRGSQSNKKVSHSKRNGNTRLVGHGRIGMRLEVKLDAM